MATSVTQNGITVNFDTDYTVGQFVMGDWWVKPNSLGGTVTISSSSPAPGLEGGTRVINGVMQDLSVGYGGAGETQAFDSFGGSYTAGSNIGPSFPTAFAASTSLIFSKSRLGIAADDRPCLSDVMVLTVIPNNITPAATDFRPPYAGTDKSLNWDSASINWDALPDLAHPNSGTNVPALAGIDGYFDKVWIECDTTANQQKYMPQNNQPNYGREMAYKINEVALSLCLNYTNSEKSQIGLGLIQYGIDIYGAVVDGGEWRSAGGFNHTRKLPMAIAGLVFNDSNILACVNRNNYDRFGEDQQTFYVAQSDIDDCPKDGDRECYIQSDLWLPEWGDQHKQQTGLDDRRISAQYRKIVAVGLVGSVLAAELLGLRSQWKHEPLFRYTKNRAWDLYESSRANVTNEINLFEADMWDAYSVADVYPVMTNPPDAQATQAALDSIKADCDTLNARGVGTSTITASDLTTQGLEAGIATQFANQVNLDADNLLGLTLATQTGQLTADFTNLYNNLVAIEAALA